MGQGHEGERSGVYTNVVVPTHPPSLWQKLACVLLGAPTGTLMYFSHLPPSLCWKSQEIIFLAISKRRHGGTVYKGDLGCTGMTNHRIQTCLNSLN
jgi:hypothetical protein